MLAENWYGEPIKPMSAERDYVVPFSGYAIKRKEIPGFFTDTVFKQIAMWEEYKMMGLPFTLGYAEHPAVYMDIITTLNAESAKRRK